MKPEDILHDEVVRGKFVKLIHNHDEKYCSEHLPESIKKAYVSRFGADEVIFNIANTDHYGCDVCGFGRDVVYLPIALFLLDDACKTSTLQWLESSMPRTRANFLALFNGDKDWRKFGCDEVELHHGKEGCAIEPIFTEEDKKHITPWDRAKKLLKRIFKSKKQQKGRT